MRLLTKYRDRYGGVLLRNTTSETDVTCYACLAKQAALRAEAIL